MNTDIIKLTEEPFTEPNQVLNVLKELIKEFKKEQGHREVFASAYSITTKNILNSIDEFENPEWMSAYLVAFANKYREAIFYYENDKGSSKVINAWKVAFDRSGRTDLATTQHLLLGIIAHIGHDLPIVLKEIVPKNTDTQKYEDDHKKTGDILIDSMDEIQREVQGQTGGAKWLDEMDQLLGELDEKGFKFFFEIMRQRAWDWATGASGWWQNIKEIVSNWISNIMAFIAKLETFPGIDIPFINDILEVKFTGDDPTARQAFEDRYASLPSIDTDIPGLDKVKIFRF